MKRLCSKFLRDESGATAIEYGLMASGITLAILGTIQTLSVNVKTMLWDVVNAATTP
jgi:pilus assembly protein Flp/PilA